MAKRRKSRNPSLFAVLEMRPITAADRRRYETVCRSWNVLSKTLSSLSEQECLAFLFCEWEGQARPIILTRLRYRHNRLRMERENRELFGTSHIYEVT